MLDNHRFSSFGFIILMQAETKGHSFVVCLIMSQFIHDQDGSSCPAIDYIGQKPLPYVGGQRKTSPYTPLDLDSQ